MEYLQNDQLRLAAEFVQFTNKNIFLTGKAGTGKTTFLHNLRKITPKRIVVVAPTGVAAINAGGVTMHSFFQLNFAPGIPEAARQGRPPNADEGFRRKFNREKIRLIKCIDLLVIDEISMVRADVLDAVDEVLRQYRHHSKPFGGVQLLMIGDLHQLSPVIKDHEWELLRSYYQSIYFFDSMALKKSELITIELKEIFRQSDTAFISLLNRVRENRIDPATISLLNSRHIPGFGNAKQAHGTAPPDREGYITLTTHNANAFNMNQERLTGLREESHFFGATIEGDFPLHDYPTEADLELKQGAQVMFIKNDPSQEKLFYNGKIGKITRIEDNTVFVKCEADFSEIEVGRLTWENIKYSLNDETKEIREDVAGTFTQLPLKLAWAITIHKSQGLTFDKVIIDAGAAFAAGQVYVALSRCRTFEGIILSTPITGTGIKTDSLVQNYSIENKKNEPDEAKLVKSKHGFQQELIIELFDLNLIRYRFENLLKHVRENAKILQAETVKELQSKKDACDLAIFSVAQKFRPQLISLFQSAILPEENTALQERISKASTYFGLQLSTLTSPIFEDLNFDTDNKAVGKILGESLEKFQKDVYIRMKCFEVCRQGFETITYLKTRSNAEVDFIPSAKQKSRQPPRQMKNIPHADLYNALRQWRDDLADQNDVPRNLVLPQKSMLEMVKKLPVSTADLKTVKGLGQVKIRQFGEEIIDIIRDYCHKNNIAPAQSVITAMEKQPRIPSGKLSYDLFKSGMTIDEIAANRKLAMSTIESHLAFYVGTGELAISDLIAEEKLGKLMEYFSSNHEKSIGEMKKELGEEISFGDLRLLRQHFNAR